MGTDRGGTPTPPAPHRPPRLAPVSRVKIDRGPELCISTRPDLAWSLLSLELAGDLPPEELHLLRWWLKSEIEEKLSEVSISWDPPACADSFLCLAVPADATTVMGQAVLEALSAPGSAAFYRIRPDALATAAERDRSDASWKLNTAARALRAESPGTARLRHLSEVDEQALQSIVERHAGAKKEQSLPLYALEKYLARAVDGARLTLGGPNLTVGGAERLRDHYTRPNLDVPPQESLVDSPRAPVGLPGDAPDVAQAILLWELPRGTSTPAVEAALNLLVDRWRARGGPSLRVWVQPAGGLYALPALRVDGAYEDVLSAVSELSEEYDQLISTYGSPSEDEWQAAELGAPDTRHFESRCQNSEAIVSPVDRMNAARGALREAGPPTVVVWGSEVPPTSSE